MTLQELTKLRIQIVEYKEKLSEKDLSIDIITEAIEILGELGAHKGLVNVWYSCNKKQIDSIIEEIERLS